jgi:hypothetical protein
MMEIPIEDEHLMIKNVRNILTFYSAGKYTDIFCGVGIFIMLTELLPFGRGLLKFEFILM